MQNQHMGINFVVHSHRALHKVEVLFLDIVPFFRKIQKHVTIHLQKPSLLADLHDIT